MRNEHITKLIEALEKLWRVSGVSDECTRCVKSDKQGCCEDCPNLGPNGCTAKPLGCAVFMCTDNIHVQRPFRGFPEQGYLGYRPVQQRDVTFHSKGEHRGSVLEILESAGIVIHRHIRSRGRKYEETWRLSQRNVRGLIRARILVLQQIRDVSKWRKERRNFVPLSDLLPKGGIS